jgi:hypothetical protein
MRTLRLILTVLGFVFVLARISAAASAATVTCTDGSTSKAGRGACSHHGGVAKGDTGTPAPEKPAAKAPAAKSSAPAATARGSDAAGATAKCKDGSYSHSTHHSGTCSRHGGVAQWLDGSKQ